MAAMEMQPLRGGGGALDTDEETGECGAVSQGCVKKHLRLIIIILVLVLYLGTELVAWLRFASCASEQGTNLLHWNQMIPTQTTKTTKVPRAFTFFYDEMDVFDSSVSNTSKIGYWTDMHLFHGWIRRYAYVRSQPTGDQVVMEAMEPFGLYFGKRFELWQCDGTGPEYFLKEDIFNEPWFQWNSAVQIYNIYNGKGVHLAISQHVLSNMLSWGNTYWNTTIVTPQGEIVSHLVQETWNQAGWNVWQPPSYFSKNLRPDILPNEVVSFMASIFELRAASSGRRRHR
eukprot:TRINITY_DN18050_c0_g1_i1.p1 TRINITY_DN18050_c0_g1~~TRINITY_DN18050_c0_g1_i1.p1  ORF type:complete len:286 (-),score=41.62 TRINITY_DN18050_c0_g1_i1:246-1103(-)